MNRIDKYIEEQKTVKPSPFLESRILARINAIEIKQGIFSTKVMVWQTLAIAVSFVLIAALGVTIGGSYKSSNRDQAGIVVNDSYIEQLSLYTDYADE